MVQNSPPPLHVYSVLHVYFFKKFSTCSFIHIEITSCKIPSLEYFEFAYLALFCIYCTIVWQFRKRSIGGVVGRHQKSKTILARPLALFSKSFHLNVASVKLKPRTSNLRIIVLSYFCMTLCWKGNGMKILTFYKYINQSQSFPEFTCAVFG